MMSKGYAQSLNNNGLEFENPALIVKNGANYINYMNLRSKIVDLELSSHFVSGGAGFFNDRLWAGINIEKSDFDQLSQFKLNLPVAIQLRLSANSYVSLGGAYSFKNVSINQKMLIHQSQLNNFWSANFNPSASNVNLLGDYYREHNLKMGIFSNNYMHHNVDVFLGASVEINVDNSSNFINTNDNQSWRNAYQNNFNLLAGLRIFNEARSKNSYKSKDKQINYQKWLSNSKTNMNHSFFANYMQRTYFKSLMTTYQLSNVYKECIWSLSICPRFQNNSNRNMLFAYASTALNVKVIFIRKDVNLSCNVGYDFSSIAFDTTELGIGLMGTQKNFFPTPF